MPVQTIVPSASGLRVELRRAARPGHAALLQRFFKTGKGEYGEGDKFLGLTVPEVRAAATKYRGLGLAGIKTLLASPWHEDRLCALILLVDMFRRGDETVRAAVFKFYLANTRFINNWDLVDVSAPRIVGGWLKDKDRKILLKLAASRSLWERRISMLACFAFIDEGESAYALKLAEKLLDDKEDLMHKVVGWMLREIGKRCSEKVLVAFLKKNYARLPRTTLRYAIERFPIQRRKALLKGVFH